MILKKFKNTQHTHTQKQFSSIHFLNDLSLTINLQKKKKSYSSKREKNIFLIYSKSIIKIEKKQKNQKKISFLHGQTDRH